MQLETMMAPLFAPVEIGADLSSLPENERRALAKIVDAARIMDGIFLGQVWAGNPSMLMDLVKDQSPQGRARLDFFLVNKGPWSRLEHNNAFVPGAPSKPEGANFYPAGAPYQYYTGEVAGRCLNYAESILEEAKRLLRK